MTSSQRLGMTRAAAARLLAVVCTTDPANVQEFSDRFRRKLDDYNYLVKSRPGFNRGEFDLPMGVVQGQKVVQFFRRHFAVMHRP